MSRSLKGNMMGDQVRSFQERLSAFVDDERKKAKLLPSGPAREAALTKIRQAETAADLDAWSNPPRTQASK
jgi:hypothetical protein